MPVDSAPVDHVRIAKLGKLGELAFTTWATQSDLVVNGSQNDEAGWDFLVELAPASASPEIPDAPVHTETFPFKGFVQVKATDGTPGYVSIKLSNWLRMVHDPQPAYVAVLEFDGLDEPQRVYLIHVGEALIRRVLRRFHENAIGGARPLHKLDMRLTYTEDDRLHSPAGSALLDRLLETRAEGGDTWTEYSAWKGGLVRTAGYEAGNVQIRVTVPAGQDPPPNPTALWSDLETGITQSIPVASAEFFRTRFGIVDDTPFAERGPSLLQVTGERPAIYVNVEVRAEGTTTRRRFIASLYAPSGISRAIKANEDLSSYKVRVHAPHFEVVADFENQTGTFNAEPPEVGVSVGARTVKLHAELASVVATADRRGTTVEIEVRHGETVLMRSAIDRDGVEAFGDAASAAEVLGRYVSLCALFNVLDEASVAFDQIEERQEAMRLFANYASDAVGLDDFTFSLIPNDEGRAHIETLEDQRVAALSPWAVTLGSHTFAVVLVAWGTLERLAERDGAIEYRIAGDPIVRAARLAHKGSVDDFPMWELVTDAAHAAKELEATDNFIVLGLESMGTGPLGPTPNES